MIEFLVKKFVPDKDNIHDPQVRQRYGTLGSSVGILCNVVLFAVKFISGLMTGAISIMADAMNNLSDAGSSVVTLIGFYMAGKPADLDHPFGHGRIEYLSGLFVAVAILFMGVELFKTSVDKIFHPEDVQVTLFSVAILVLAILLKFWMAHFNRVLGERISSEAMKATAADSLSDCVATAAVLGGMLVTYFTGKNIDGFVGILVALFVLNAGYGAAKDTIQPLLGAAPEPDLIDGIQKCVMSYDKVLGIHDLIVHDYGPGRRMISLHAEVSHREDILELHEEIDVIERNLMDRFQCMATIHMDPIVTDDVDVIQAKDDVKAILKSMDDRWKFHDFRMVKGKKSSNVIFDVVIPMEQMKEKDEIEEQIRKNIHEKHPKYNAVVTVEQSYV
ncbi:cation diffusion facilitator family transporter [Anaerostipes sp. 992a]|uniref:cation diffusion facilitator family transporter n=1 Tax=Anaerostipes sp. 992a TaxID=1261637 RepID=UPI0009528AA0|nr:cation diffusion facilitator family transporter [Anaerostipes sp. 992a]OLR63141.1 cation diffusion facilitator family transporter [Anaerostipes sp. 992a]